MGEISSKYLDKTDSVKTYKTSFCIERQYHQYCQYTISKNKISFKCWRDLGTFVQNIT